MTQANKLLIRATCIIILSILFTTVLCKEKCPSFCKFRFCHRFFKEGTQVQIENRGLAIIPNSMIGAFPCRLRPGGFIRELRNVTGGEARVSRRFENDFVPISKFMSNEVSPSFSSEQFFWVLNKRVQRSSITRVQSRGNQEEKLNRACVQMPVTSYLTRDGRRMHTRGKRACVAFSFVMPRLLVEFQWDSRDDFDLRLQEPNGFEINRFGGNYISPITGGEFRGDNGNRPCQDVAHKERISYRANDVIEKGNYTVRVDHRRSCESVTKYYLRVLYQGRIILFEQGTLDSVVQDDVVVISFTVQT